MKTSIRKVWVILPLACVLCGASPAPHLKVVNAQRTAKAQRKVVAHYACPMHPEVVSTRPGKCRKCGMRLRLVEEPKESAAAANTAAVAPVANPSEATSLRIPNTPVVDQNGKRISFYDDLVKGKIVAINFIFTTCTTICPPMTATFRRVQQDLVAKGSDAQLISVSVDPTTDTPERLRDFAAKFKAGPGWTFVTGDRIEIDSLLQAFGVAVADKNDHTPMILIGNDRTGFWSRAYGLAAPGTLVKAIDEAANHR